MVLIAMIVTILTVNSYSSMKQRRSLRSAAESVRDVLTNARSLSVSKNTWYRVVIQLRDPATNEPKVGYWIDEIDPGTSTNANPATLDAAARALVVPWQSITEHVEFMKATIKGTDYTVILPNLTENPTQPNPYLVIRFMPNGTSDGANIQLLERDETTPTGPITSEIRLYSSTAKANIVAARP